jgi:hypothetical protein
MRSRPYRGRSGLRTARRGGAPDVRPAALGRGEPARRSSPSAGPTDMASPPRTERSHRKPPKIHEFVTLVSSRRGSLAHLGGSLTLISPENTRFNGAYALIANGILTKPYSSVLVLPTSGGLQRRGRRRGSGEKTMDGKPHFQRAVALDRLGEFAHLRAFCEQPGDGGQSDAVPPRCSPQRASDPRLDETRAMPTAP